MTRDACWRRFMCMSGNAKACAEICEHERLPDSIVVTVSIDLRRAILFWRLPRDLQLVRQMALLLEGEGAKLLDEDENKG
jgi:hypothetical protein